MLNEKTTIRKNKNCNAEYHSYLTLLRSGKKSLCTEKKYPYTDIINKIIFCSMEVHSRLGPGLLESLYEKALAFEFDLRHMNYERQKEIQLQYKGRPIGRHRISFLVEDKVVVGLKAVESGYSIYHTQMFTFLKAMNKKVGLLINFNTERLQDGIKKLLI